ncbi:pseudouridine synthase [bacterium]|nr:pseudouridine synthase [bacterium]
MAQSDKESSGGLVRLQVLLARCGLGSRRHCEELIRDGRVSVDGEPVTEQGQRVDPDRQRVEVDFEPLRPDRHAYYMVNKPKGVLCTNADPDGRKRVIDLFPASAGRLFPIGRLDENSLGLILVTNDGELSHRLAHPKFRVPKVYHVHVAGVPNPETLKKLQDGMYFSDGRFKADRVKKLKTRGKSTILEMTLSEGRNREIRRLLARVGHKVMKLERVQFGPLKLRGVAAGQYRALTSAEIKLLHDYSSGWKDRAAQQRKKKPQAAQKRETNSGETPTPAARHKPVSAPKRIVEISPLATSSGHDLTGRTRNTSRAKSTHPAIVQSSRPSPAKPHPRKKAARKKRKN